MHPDSLYPLFPVFSFLGFILVLIPFPWHLQAWNSGTCFYMMWTALACLNQFINSVVWANDAMNRAPVFCDISIRITIAASFGIPASALCIVRRLYIIASVRSASVSVSEKRKAMIVDAMIAVLFPLVLTALSYVVQGHRFDVLEEMGCAFFFVNTHLSYVLVFMWPVVIGLVSSVYCILALFAFRRQQLEISRFLRSNSSLTVSRYVRLMALAMTETMFTVPLGIFVIVLNATATKVHPWISWEETHYDFGFVGQFPALFWRTQGLVVVSFEMNRWAPVFCAFVFFGFFGFAEECRKNYKSTFFAVLKCLGMERQPSKSSLAYSPKSSSSSFSFGKFRLSKGNTESSSVHTLPVFVTKAVVSSTSASDCSTPTLYTHASYAASLSSRDPSSPTNSEIYSFSTPPSRQPAPGEQPPMYDSQRRSSTTTTTSSVIPPDPSPFLVPFDFEHHAHVSETNASRRFAS